MEREVELYFVAVLLVGIVFLFAFFSHGFTGFAISSDMSSGTYNGAMWSGSALVLNSSANVTSGTYTSPVLDAGNDSSWSNLTWTGIVPDNSSVSFKVTSCSDENCSDASFQDAAGSNGTIDLGSLNLTSRYFQYKITLSKDSINTTSPSVETVDLAYTEIQPEGFAINIVSPTQQTYSSNSTALKVTANENVSAWWYTLNSGSETSFTPNTTITSSDGSNTLTVYANDSNGTIVNESISYTIQLPTPSSCDSSHLALCTESECDNLYGSDYWYNNNCHSTVQAVVNTNNQTQQTPIPTKVAIVSLGTIQPVNLIASGSQQVTADVSNIGDAPLTSCKLKSYGDLASWFSTSTGPFNLDSKKAKKVSFTLTVPDGTKLGKYSVGVSAECKENVISKSVTVNVIQKTFEFNLTDASKVSSGVRATYTLSDLSGKDQTVSLDFSVMDNTSKKVAEVKESQNLSANDTKKFRTLIPMNDTAGNFTIHIDANSGEYKGSVEEAVTKSAPILGFTIFNDNGSIGFGGIIILVIMISGLAFLVFWLRKMRRTRKEHRKSKSSESESSA